MPNAVTDINLSYTLHMHVFSVVNSRFRTNLNIVCQTLCHAVLKSRKCLLKFISDLS